MTEFQVQSNLFSYLVEMMGGGREKVHHIINLLDVSHIFFLYLPPVAPSACKRVSNLVT